MSVSMMMAFATEHNEQATVHCFRIHRAKLERFANPLGRQLPLTLSKS
jgi:hypothetical protein